jgi:hypothetical protein
MVPVSSIPARLVGTLVIWSLIALVVLLTDHAAAG